MSAPFPLWLRHSPHFTGRRARYPDRVPTLLAADDLFLTRAERPILAGVGLSLGSGERVALLGRNGAGKTTLLDLLSGRAVPEEGRLWRAPGLRIASLGQHAIYPPGVTVEALIGEADPYRALEEQLRDLEAHLADAPESLSAWTELHDYLEAANAWTWPARVARTLGVLTLDGLRAREAMSLSGGERTRLALALALLQEPELLLLDEPTNHLDLRMREWLEGQLLAFRGALLFVSHDRELSDRVATRSLWIEGGELTGYPGGYSRARAQRDLERRSRARAHRLGSREEDRLQGAVEWLDLRGRRSQAVRTRAARVPVVEAPLPERALRMRMLAGQARARVLLWARHLSVQYGGRVVLSDASLKLRQGDRVALMGANGTGKTSLLRLLAGETYSDDPRAELRYEGSARVAYLDQTWHGLDPERPLRAQFAQRFGEGRANALLGQAGFGARDWPRYPDTLSGGERARAGLALVSALRADVLLLDEPTNHLDVETLETLEGALAAYPGAVVIVTHDRRFARTVATRWWLIEDARLSEPETWGSRTLLDPDRSLEGDPPPPRPPLSPRERTVEQEIRLSAIARELDLPGLGGRDEARLRAERHRRRQALDALYADLYAAETWDGEAKTPHLRVRAQRFETGAMFYAAVQPDCPHLAWDGETLRWMPEAPPAWFGTELLEGALRLLFERWNVGRVTLGEGGPVLRRRAWAERVGLIRTFEVSSP